MKHALKIEPVEPLDELSHDSHDVSFDWLKYSQTKKLTQVISQSVGSATVKLTFEIMDNHNELKTLSDGSRSSLPTINTEALIQQCRHLLASLENKKQTESLFLDKNNQQIVFAQQNSIKLTQLEFSLMALLSSKPGQLFSRDQIITQAYHQERDITDRAIDSHIKNLRRKIRLLGVKYNVIESVYGSGYRYSLPTQ